MVKKMLRMARDIFELYIPAIAFLTMFIACIIQIFGQQVLRIQLPWTQDLIRLGFVWAVLFGACYTMRLRRHIKFTMIYEKLGPKGAAFSRLVGNMVIMIAFILLILPSWRYTLSLRYAVSSAMRISHVWVFLPFIYLILSVIGYAGARTIEDYQVLRGIIADSAEHRLREYTR